jgi:hypothetical protein
MGTGAIVSGVADGGSARVGAVGGELNPQAVNSTAKSRAKQHRQTGFIVRRCHSVARRRDPSHDGVAFVCQPTLLRGARPYYREARLNVRDTLVDVVVQTQAM